MLDLAVSPLDDFSAPLNTIKLAPVTAKKNKPRCSFLSFFGVTESATFSRFRVDVDRVRRVGVLVASLRVLYADQVGVGGRAEVATERQDVVARVIYALHDLEISDCFLILSSQIKKKTIYLIVAIRRNRHDRVFSLHVDGEAAYVRQRVGVVPEILKLYGGEFQKIVGKGIGYFFVVQSSRHFLPHNLASLRGLQI